ncbi:MAG: SMC-Scp complex subunit ScpB [Fuerstiella sp.]
MSSTFGQKGPSRKSLGSNFGLRLKKQNSGEQLQRSRQRSGSLYELKSTIDTSHLHEDGRLVRSKRLGRLEACLLISGSAVSASKLASLAGLVDAAEAVELLELLNRSYDLSGSAFRVERTATGYLLMTRPALVDWLDRLHQRQAEMKLTPPMMETLTIIGYQQPITRAGVESIRGVQSSEMIRQLVERHLVKVGGEEDSLGRPFLYITTRQFLDMFGLGRVEDLPDFDTIGRKPDTVKMPGVDEESSSAETVESEDVAAVASEADDQSAASSQTDSNDQQAA